MRRDGGENKNTIRMYILPRLLGFFALLPCALDIVCTASFALLRGFSRGTRENPLFDRHILSRVM